MIMIIINICLLIVALILTKTILKQKKLILSYENNLKKQGNMQRLMHLANLAKSYGHDMVIEYSTIYDCYHVFFYANGKGEYEPYCRKITDDESFEAVINELERLIK